MDLFVNDDVSELQQGSENECRFYVAYHMIRLASNFKNLKGAKVSLCQIYLGPLAASTYIYLSYTHSSFDCHFLLGRAGSSRQAIGRQAALGY